MPRIVEPAAVATCHGSGEQGVGDHKLDRLEHHVAGALYFAVEANCVGPVLLLRLADGLGLALGPEEQLADIEALGRNDIIARSGAARLCSPTSTAAAIAVKNRAVEYMTVNNKVELKGFVEELKT